MRAFLLFLTFFLFCLMPNSILGNECIVGDCINGQGTLITPNGEKYTGQFKDGLKSGQGILTLPNGEVYTGSFAAGEPNGHGIHTYPDGGRYEGEFMNKLYEGQGTLTLPDGRKYVGEFSRGKAKGNGTLTLANGEKYIGEFVDGIGNGKGKYFFPDGTVYEGEWKSFKYDGKGKIISSNGIYNGQFKNGQRNGIGKLILSDGETYVGNWKDDNKNGYGILTLPNGEIYQGIWQNDKFLHKSEGYIPPENTYSYKGTEEKINASKEVEEVSSGTAFYINNKGYLVTNYHVVNNCKKLEVSHSESKNGAKTVFADEINDLAIVKSDNSSEKFAKLRGGKGIRVGEDIITVGYPLGIILGESLKVTTGNISSVTGIANDTSIMQISAPTQPGSSGGPVLDMSGNVVGVVSSGISELAVAKLTGSLPQIINFAIKSSTLQTFLDTHEINYELGKFDAPLNTVDIAEKAQGYTVRITCFK